MMSHHGRKVKENEPIRKASGLYVELNGDSGKTGLERKVSS